MERLDNYSNGNERKRYVSERTGFDGYNVLIAVIALLLIIVGIILTSIVFEFNTTEVLTMSILLAIFYCVILFILAMKKNVREVKTMEVRTVAPTVKQAVEQPMVQDFTPIIPSVVEKPVIRTRTIYKTKIVRPKPIVKTVYKTRYKTRIVKPVVKKLNIPKFNYIGSTQTRTYHTRNCRLGKLVKKKFKLMDNRPDFFQKRKFRACKVCILKQKKI